ncbi:MAG: NADH-quinone oxidoreductase subunit [Candidatus Hydrogenedentes bacterium]|nr:NADH-quinone oxidoreductase subunit [Candidatus Hydrogenedentota bacterium]
MSGGAADAMAIVTDLRGRFPEAVIGEQATCDGVPTVWVARDAVPSVLRYLKAEAAQPYSFLYDLTAIDERTRIHREGQPPSDFTVVYHLLSYERNADVRVKAPLEGEYPTIPSIAPFWPVANWYEREVYDMFGIVFEGHPNLRRILMPNFWKGHPLRKEHPARATEMPPFQISDELVDSEQEALRFVPEEWGMKRQSADADFMFLNLGPQHPGTHGLLRVILQLDGEKVVDAVPDIGYHHRGAEKMGERQSWHTYIPYTDRIDYTSGVMNNLPYVMSVEQLAGIEVPPRAQTIRVMMSELFRVISHCVWYGTFAQDLGAMSPVFYLFNDRERAFGLVEAICGGRMHPSWFRIGGVAHDLPAGWDRMMREFLAYLPPRLASYDRALMKNRIWKARTVGVGAYDRQQAIDWGVTGPGLRATGFEWDMRKKRPYSGYEQFTFDIPTAQRGDCYDRAVVRIEEMRQSLRIIEQCVDNMPEGPYKAEHPLTTPPNRDRMQHDIETLINHFLAVSWGPVIPAGESLVNIEASKGNNGYYLVSDGCAMSYRTRVRTPSFPHMPMLPEIVRNARVSDVLAVLGAMDFVLADLDR